MGQKYEMKDSGVREEFSTGAVRDTRDGKGRYDLISPFAIKRLALVLEKGAAKYTARNWEKGWPLTRTLDSAIRHMYQYIEGKNDEDHLGHAMFNVMAAMHFEEMAARGVLDPSKIRDMPDYEKRETASEGGEKERNTIKEKLEAMVHQGWVEKLDNAGDYIDRRIMEAQAARKK